MIGTQHLRHLRARRWIQPLGLAVVLASVAACAAGPGGPGGRPAPGSAAGDDTRQPSPAVSSVGSPDPSTGVATPTTAPTTATGPTTATTPATSTRPATGAIPIRVTVGDRVFTAELYDNPTAHDLADQLPLTVTMDDLHRLEKTGPLPRALTTEGVPAGSDPTIDEIGYYAPGRDLVLYYGDVGYFNGIVRIGRFDDPIQSIATESDGLRVTVERA